MINDKWSMIKMPMKNPYHYILLFILIIVLFGAWAGQGVYLAKDKFSEEEKTLTIRKGESLKEIASLLAEEDMIKSRVLFLGYALLTRRAKSLQAGDYKLSPAMSIADILSRVVVGSIATEKITVIEGWKAADIAKSLAARGLVEKPEDFLAVLRLDSWQDQYDFLKEVPLKANWQIEGYLFPDTYEIFPGSSSQDIAKKMLDNFATKTAALEQEIAQSGKKLFDLIRMASIVEKEVKSFEDKQLAAGLLWKRLKSGWPLQVDATLTYLTGKPSSALTLADLEIDSPYNTYKYYGLPLAPISNPGLDSIKAAIDYKENDFWFYLTTPGDDRVIFNETLAGHEAARREHLK